MYANTRTGFASDSLTNVHDVSANGDVITFNGQPWVKVHGNTLRFIPTV